MTEDEILELAKKKGWRYDKEIGLVFEGERAKLVGRRAYCPSCDTELLLTKYIDWIKGECKKCGYVGDITV